MIIDAPQYDTDEKKEKKEKVYNLQEQSAEDFQKLIDKYQ